MTNVSTRQLRLVIIAAVPLDRYVERLPEARDERATGTGQAQPESEKHDPAGVVLDEAELPRHAAENRHYGYRPSLACKPPCQFASEWPLPSADQFLSDELEDLLVLLSPSTHSGVRKSGSSTGRLMTAFSLSLPRSYPPVLGGRRLTKDDSCSARSVAKPRRATAMAFALPVPRSLPLVRRLAIARAPTSVERLATLGRAPLRGHAQPQRGETSIAPCNRRRARLTGQRSPTRVRDAARLLLVAVVRDFERFLSFWLVVSARRLVDVDLAECAVQALVHRLLPGEKGRICLRLNRSLRSLRGDDLILRVLALLLVSGPFDAGPE